MPLHPRSLAAPALLFLAACSGPGTPAPAVRSTISEATTTTAPEPTTVPTTEPPTTVPEAPPAVPEPVTTAPATTEAPRRLAPTAAPATPSSGRCGGSLPPCYVLDRESGGDPAAVNPSSGAAGKWQMMPSTSQALGYSHPMNEYDEATQDEAARLLYAAGVGCSHWQAC